MKSLRAALTLLFVGLISLSASAQDVPAEAKKHYENGVALYGKREYKDALAELNKAIELHPDYAPAF